MPMNHALYPTNWRAISSAVRTDAGNRCEFCGLPNGAVGSRDKHGTFWTPADLDTLDPQAVIVLFNTPWPKMLQVVLTVAHLDHNPANNERANLRALCQRCHLVHDRFQHARNAAQTRAAKKRQHALRSGQLELFEKEGQYE